MCVCATGFDFEQEVGVMVRFDVVNLLLEIELRNRLVYLLISHYTSLTYNLFRIQMVTKALKCGLGKGTGNRRGEYTVAV